MHIARSCSSQGEYIRFENVCNTAGMLTEVIMLVRKDRISGIVVLEDANDSQSERRHNIVVRVETINGLEEISLRDISLESVEANLALLAGGQVQVVD